MNSIHEFHTSSVPVVGVRIAGRVWRAWEDGALTGVTYHQVWEVRGNEAYCPYVGHLDGTNPEVPAEWRTRRDPWTYPAHAYAHGARQSLPHNPGAMGCSCGWWTYHDLGQAASWMHSTRGVGVVGVVQVYGTSTRGTKGYRSQFAQIAALVEPTWADKNTHAYDIDVLPPPRELWDLVRDRYPVSVHPSLEAAVAAVRGGES